MLAVIILLQIIIIGYLIKIDGKLPKRDVVADAVQEAMERDEKIRKEKERSQ
ncbi:MULTISPECIES: hypothetical protein [unclassified Paenibacillus]|nr:MULTISPECIES: hypothetical protein [unclassified Paenibacillus]SDW88601.1 hypothetical protein SAMN05518848_103274 [Paenibacillus sp. PDC88]